jgi:polyisoprenyl-teichoic acid--peptidoglycan teichoic acid transferase
MRQWLVWGLIGLAAGFIPGYWLWLRTEPALKGPESDRVLAAQDPAPLPESVTDLDQLNLLLLGQGGPGHEGGELTDAIILVHVDFKQAKIGLISIPRDLWIEERKINTLFGADYGLLKNAMATVTGQTPNYFLAIDFVGFQRAMGYVLEGIEVDVAQDFDDPWYPTEGKQLDPCGYTPEEITELTAKYSDFELQKHFPCRYERVSFQKGRVFMNGAEALKYVRSRHSSSDFDRSRRQHEVLAGIKNKLFSLQALDNVPKFFQAFSEHVRSDIDLDVARYLAPALKNTQDYKIISLNLSTENVLKATRTRGGAFGLVPKNNWDEVRAYVKNQ